MNYQNEPNIPGIEYQHQVSKYADNLKTIYQNEPNIPSIETVLFYGLSAPEFIPPVLHKLDNNKIRQNIYFNERDGVHFESIFEFKGTGQRILIQGSPGTGKSTLVHQLTQEWTNKTGKISECPLLLRITLRELRGAEQPLNLSSLMTMNNNIIVDRALELFLYEPVNNGKICIIFDGLDEYPPAYTDPSNFIYRVLKRDLLKPATVIVTSRPEAYKNFFELCGTSSGFHCYALTGFDSHGIEEYIMRNIEDQNYAFNFTNYLKERPVLYRLCSSPLHLAVLVNSAKGESEFPSTLTKAYIKSLTKYLKREVQRTTEPCHELQLDKFVSLQECHQDLAETVANVSKLAYDSLIVYDLNLTLHGRNLKYAKTQFLEVEIHSYLPNSESYGLLSAHQQYILDKYKTMPRVTKFSFPHLVVQEFWAAYHTAITMKIDISDYDTRIFLHKPYLYFACGLYYSNASLLNQTFKLLLVNFQNQTWPGLLNDFSMCGFESERSSDVLAHTLLHLYGPRLKLDHVAPFSNSSSHPEVLHFQSLLGHIHSNITQIHFTQYAPSLRLYIEAISNPFPFLNTIDVHMQFPTIMKTGVKYLPDFSENLQLFLNRPTMPSLPKMKWFLPMDILVDQNFTNLLEGGFDMTIEHMDVTVVGTIVSEVPRDLQIYASCPLQWNLFPVVKISSGEFNTFLGRFTMAFHKLKGINFTVVTQLLLLDCTYVKTFLQTLHNSSTLVQNTEIVDTCSYSYISYTPSDNGSVYMMLHNSTSNTQHILTLELSTGFIHDDLHTTQYCTNKQLYMLL